MVIDKDIRDTRYIHLLELTTQSIYAVRAILYIIYYTYIYIYCNSHVDVYHGGTFRERGRNLHEKVCIVVDNNLI